MTVLERVVELLSRCMSTSVLPQRTKLCICPAIARGFGDKCCLLGPGKACKWLSESLVWVYIGIWPLAIKSWTINISLIRSGARNCNDGDSPMTNLALIARLDCRAQMYVKPPQECRSEREEGKGEKTYSRTYPCVQVYTSSGAAPQSLIFSVMESLIARTFHVL